MENNLPTIRLAGKDYPVKPLVLKQLRVVEPAWDRLRRSGGVMSSELVDDMIDIVYLAIAPSCEPKMSRDDFTNLPIPLNELTDALPTIARQAGMYVKEADAGEAPAGSQ